MGMVLTWLAVVPLLGYSISVGAPPKTDAQILAMGSWKWADYRLDQGGYRGVGQWREIVGEAMDEYCAAAKRRNAKILSSPRLPHRQERRRLCELLPLYGDTMMSFYEAMGGNNFMEMLISETRADAQDAIYAYLHPAGRKRAKPHVVSDVTKLLREWQTRVDMDNGDGAEDEANHKLAAAKTMYREIVLLVSKTTGRAGSDQILSFCVEASALTH